MVVRLDAGHFQRKPASRVGAHVAVVIALGHEQALRFDNRNGLELHVLLGRALYEQRNVDARDGGDFRVAARGLAIGEHYDGGALRGNLD